MSIGAKGVKATVTASDGQSGLAKDPSGSYPINTSTAGVKTVKVTAIDNVGHETEASCSTLVGYTQVITTNLKGNLTIKAGQAIELTKTAKVSGNVVVKPGGALDVEGATISGTLNSKGAALLRICGANSRQSDGDQQHRLGRDRRRQRRMPVEQIRRRGHDQSQQSRRADRRKHLQRLAESASTTKAARR